MKKLILFLIVITFLIPKQSKAQNEGAAVAAVAAGALVIGAGIAAVKQMEERAELNATQWILSNNPEFTSFSLKTLSFDGKKVKDMSGVSIILYNLQEFQPGDDPEINGKKYVLFGFTSRGWISEQGIDFNKVKWKLVDKMKWLDMMTSYVKVASSNKDENSIEEILKNGKIVNKGVKENGKLKIPFFKMSGDLYVVTDYSEDLKLIYNERSLGIFLKKTNDLVQIGRGDIIKIHEFLFEQD